MTIYSVVRADEVESHLRKLNRSLVRRVKVARAALQEIRDSIEDHPENWNGDVMNGLKVEGECMCVRHVAIRALRDMK